MKLKNFFTTILLLIFAGTVQNLLAQSTLTVGSKITAESNLVSGNAYLIYYVGNSNSSYMMDMGNVYKGKNKTTPTENAVYFITDNGDGTWLVKNYYTGKYWGEPTANANAYIGADTGGRWALNFQSNGNIAPSCNGHSWNRSDENLHPWSEGIANTNQFQIYEVALSSTTPYGEFTNKDIFVDPTAVSSIETNTWYVMSQRSRSSYVFEDLSGHTLKHTLTVPNGPAISKANYLVRLVNGDNGKYYLQTGLGNYVGQITGSTNVPTTPLKQEQHTVAMIGSNDGHFYIQSVTGDVVLDANDFSAGDPSTVVGWGTSAPTSTGGNNDWAFYPITLTDSWIPTVSEVYTINNTNSGRGAMMYNGSSNYVWVSGKDGATFSDTDPNCQWVIFPTAVTDQFYLYNVGAQKFAIPSGTASKASWIFSSSAVAVTLIIQSDGTYKVKTATTNTYAAVSKGYNGPIINYNDEGGNFTITKVDGDQSSAVNTAVSKIVDNIEALSAVPTSGTDGWYIIRIKTHNTYADKYIYPALPEVTYNGTNYALTFDHGANIRPAIDDVTYYTHITNEGGTVYWQMPNGKYLYGNSNKFPISTFAKSSFSMDYTNNKGFRMWGSSRYAVPYLLNSQYFIGETSSAGNAYYDIYPIDLAAAGLTAWQMVCDNAPETQEITCSRNDVNGLSTVYKNGYIFLPSDVTPEAEEFTLDGATSVTVDASNHTVAFAYDPNLAIVEGGIVVEQGWQTAGRDGEVKLLRVTAKPFKDATGTSMTISLKEGTVDNISKLTLYEADSSSPEVLSTGEGAPTLTIVDEVDVTTSTETLNIGNFTAGTHYYWIGATVKGDATLGSVLDAAVTDITYTCNDNETMLDLASIGDPADRGAMIFNTRSHPFLPRDNGSRVYRIPAMVVADDGSIVVACDKRYDSHTDIGKGHVIDIVVRRSTDGGQTWSEPIVIAKGDNSNDATCGYGDPSLIKGKDGKIYCFFGAGNIGYFYGLNRICMSVSTDNGQTWSSSAANPPADLVSTGKVTDHANAYGSNTCYGLYDYFVTSGRGLCTSEGYLMGLLPAQVYTNEGKTEKTSNSQDYIFYSTDQGQTWHFSEQAIFTGGDEAKVIQRNDGSLLASVRQGYNRGFNTATYTLNPDGTLNFTMGTQWNNSQLNAGGYANNQDIFYYQRVSETGKTDVIFHSMTAGQHANFKLYYSTDEGANWTEFLTVQTKGTRYVTMEKSGTEANPGSLYLFFEDQSLNATGGYTDYNHYPLNFLEITREQLVQLIPALDEVPDHNAKEVKIVYGTTAETNYGTWDSSKTTWISNDNSGLEGLKLEKSAGTFDRFSNWQSRYNLSYKMEPGTQTLTLTAPEGYIITGYSLQVARPFSKDYDYTLTAEDGTSVSIGAANAFFDLNVEGLQKKSTDITVTETGTETQNNYVAIANFIVQLTIPTIIPGDIYGDDEVNDTDLLYMVGYLVGTVSGEDINLDAADLTGDGNVTLADLTALINVLREN